MRFLRRFRRDQKGVAAIEFALVAVPFFFILFAALETALVIGAGVVLNNAVDAAARRVLVGSVQTADITPQKFREGICNDVRVLLSCDRLKIDMRTYPTFGSIPRDAPEKLGRIDDTGFCFDPGAQDEITVVRAFYEWPWVAALLQRATEAKSGNATLFAMAAFMNEPFGNAASTKSTC